MGERGGCCNTHTSRGGLQATCTANVAGVCHSTEKTLTQRAHGEGHGVQVMTMSGSESAECMQGRGRVAAGAAAAAAARRGSAGRTSSNFDTEFALPIKDNFIVKTKVRLMRLASRLRYLQLHALNVVVKDMFHWDSLRQSLLMKIVPTIKRLWTRRIY
eukprot:g14226.t1